MWCKGSVDVKIASFSRQWRQVQPLKVKIVELVQKSGELIGYLRENGVPDKFARFLYEIGRAHV